MCVCVCVCARVCVGGMEGDSVSGVRGIANAHNIFTRLTSLVSLQNKMLIP